MSKASYWQRGESLDYKNSGVAAIEANTVVELPGRIGIAELTSHQEPSAICMCAVFLNLTRPAKNAISMGTAVYFDKTGITEAANDGEEEPTSHTPAGFAAADAAESDTKILVKIG